MYKQMSIYDWLQPEYPAISDITDTEAALIVGDAIGMTFKYSDLFEEWEAVRGMLKLSLEYSHYSLSDNQNLFLGVGYENKHDHSGGGRPCDSIDEAIRYFKGILQNATT